LREITVIAALLYLPFGKFFHIFQRPAQLGVKLYQRAGDEGEGAICGRCGERYASLMHVDDLKRVLPQVGFNYSMSGPVGNWQELCPTSALCHIDHRLGSYSLAGGARAVQTLAMDFWPLIEDELVFPLAARLLSSAEKAAIADEMAARREVKMITANGRRA